MQQTLDDHTRTHPTNVSHKSTSPSKDYYIGRYTSASRDTIARASPANKRAGGNAKNTRIARRATRNRMEASSNIVSLALEHRTVDQTLTYYYNALTASSVQYATDL